MTSGSILWLFLGIFCLTNILKTGPSFALADGSKKETGDSEDKAKFVIDEEGLAQVMQRIQEMKASDFNTDEMRTFKNKEDFMEKVKPNMLNERKAKKDETDPRPRVTDKVFFDLTIGGEPLGRLVIGVFGEIVPKTVKNFVELAKGTKDEQGYPLQYKGSTFHRVLKYLMIQGGAMPGRPMGGYSIYGQKFEDENFKLQHYGSGWVSMANAGKDTNTCQFFISSARHKYLDGRFVVFGKVLQGMDLVRRIEFMEIDAKDAPVPEVKMAETGVIPVEEPFPVNMNDVDHDVTKQLHDEL